MEGKEREMKRVGGEGGKTDICDQLVGVCGVGWGYGVCVCVCVCKEDKLMPAQFNSQLCAWGPVLCQVGGRNMSAQFNSLGGRSVSNTF